jgi:hypothetical protein
MAFRGSIARRLFQGGDYNEVRFGALIHANLPRVSISHCAWAVYVNCGYFRYQKSDLLITIFMSNARVCEDVVSEMDVGAEGGVGHGARDLRKSKAAMQRVH